MSPVYFLDTSFLFALLNKADEHHPEAVEKQKLISNSVINPKAIVIHKSLIEN